MCQVLPMFDISVRMPRLKKKKECVRLTFKNVWKLLASNGLSNEAVLFQVNFTSISKLYLQERKPYIGLECSRYLMLT